MPNRTTVFGIINHLSGGVVADFLKAEICFGCIGKAHCSRRGSSNLTAAGIGVEDQVSNYEFNVLLRSRRTIAVFAIGARSGSFIRTDKRQRPANTSGQKPISRSAACSNAN
jgi:hypothetical protein